MPTIATIPITTAVTNAVSTPVLSGTGPSGSLLVITEFVWGSGGTSGVVFLQTSLDGGTVWIDLVNMTFATANKKRLHNLFAGTPLTTPYTTTDGTLASDSVRDSILGPIYRTKVSSVGTYAGGTTLTVTVIPGEG